MSRIQFIVLFAFLMLPFRLLAHPKNKFKYCQNPDDYRINMLSHKVRTYKIGLRIYHDFPQIFGDLQLVVVEAELKDHDWSKVTFAPILDSDYKVFEILYSYYGKNFDLMDRAEKREAIAFRTKFNSIDEERERNILYSFGVRTYPLIDKYLRLVKIADQLDRYFDPVAEEEFNKKFEPPSVREKGDVIIEPIALHYENLGVSWYRSVTRGFEFQSLKINNKRYCVDNLLVF